MNIIEPGFFTVADGEVITINVRSTGTLTLFGVTTSIFGNETTIPEGQSFRVRMDKSRATEDSDIANARATSLTLGFHFTSNKGGRYDWTVTGSGGGDQFDDFARQAGSGPEAVIYTFHII